MALRMHPMSSLALLAVTGFTLGCLGLGNSDDDSEGVTEPREDGLWDNFGVDAAGASPDSDGDGLTDAEEAELGSDPNLEDTDGDGWTDLEEVEGNTDPTRKKSHPYNGGWRIGDCHDDVEATGNQIGDIAEQFELVDQYGDNLKLHDFCDREVLLVGAAFW